MLINRTNLLPHLMLFKVIFSAFPRQSLKLKGIPYCIVDAHTQCIISNHPFTFRSAGQSSGTGRGGGCKIVIGPGCHSFGTSAIFCLSFLLEGMEIAVWAPWATLGADISLPTCWMCHCPVVGVRVPAEISPGWRETDRHVTRPLFMTLPSPS